MATSDSPRDHSADANAERSRKRVRYSGDCEEDDTMSASRQFRSPSLGGEDQDDISIQLIDSPHQDSPDEPSIQILTDSDSSVSLHDLWSEDRWSHLSPIDQVRRMAEELRKDRYFDDRSFSVIANFLRLHAGVSARISLVDIRTALYLQEEVFFGELANLGLNILLNKDDLLDPVYTDENEADVDNLIGNFLVNLVELAAGVVRLLPYITREMLSRRDSAQGCSAAKARHIHLWRYAEIAALLLLVNFPARGYLLQHSSITQGELSARCRDVLLAHDEPFSALATTFDNISRAAKDTEDGWCAAEAIVVMVHHFSDVPLAHLEAMLRTIKESILPIICGQHRRVFPVDFHERVVDFASDALTRCARQVDWATATRLYKDFVMSSTDAVLPEGVAGGHLEGALRVASQDSLAVLARYLSLAWSLQAIHKLICSSIMVVRSTGMQLLAGRLLHTFNEHFVTDSEHPIPRYAARFLRTNELTRYIFSADSHATLIARSQEIISYLGATNTYTNQETDIIWTACTTNVEAEFVKVSFNALQAVCKFLTADHLLHVAELYRDTSPAQLTTAMIDFLPELFCLIRQASESLPTERRLATAFIAFEILRRVADTGDSSANTLTLNRIALVEMSVYASRPSEDRLHILQRYIPRITSRTPDATIVAEILSLFLDLRWQAEEVSKILDMLPVIELVDELCHFSQEAVKNATSNPHVLQGVTTRLAAIVHLMSGMPTSADIVRMEDLLYQFLFDKLAHSNEARNAALLKLAQIAKANIGHAPRLLDRYLNEFAPDSSADLVTPALLQLMADPLAGRITADVLLQSEEARTLEHPLWLTLRRVAETAAQAAIAHRAIDTICKLLFEYPQKFDPKHIPKVVQIQQRFAQGLLESLSNDYPDLQQLNDGEMQRVFVRRVDILEAVLAYSLSTRAIFRNAGKSSHIKLRRSHDQSCHWSFACHIHFTQGPILELTVLVEDTSTVSELAHALSDRTGTSTNRVILNGQLLDVELRGEDRLKAVGIQPFTRILVAPTYTTSGDIDSVITIDAPVQNILSAEYSRMDRFLDGTNAVAERTSALLQHVTPPASTRSQVLDAQHRKEELLPKDRPWRTMHSIRLLHVNLNASVRLGVADESSMARSIELLTNFIIDIGPHDSVQLSAEVINCLLAFLREHSCMVDSVLPIESAKRSLIVDRLLSVIWQTFMLLETSTGASQVQRVPLMLTSYECLLLMARYDAQVWSSLKNSPQFRDMIPGFLLHRDAYVANSVAAMTLIHCEQQVTGSPHIRFYWNIISNALEDAMYCPYHCGPFFRVAIRVLALNDQLTSEGTLSAYSTFVEHIEHYQHAEALELPFPDEVVLGLLRLLEAAIVRVKTDRTDSDLSPLGHWLFKVLLFPSAHDPCEYRPLLFPPARSAALRIVKATCESAGDFRALVEASNQALSTLPRDVTSNYPGYDGLLRQTNVSAGLSNLGMTCYMNSLLQQLYGNLLFRKMILDTAISDPNRQDLLKQMQWLFVQMQNSVLPSIDTSPLAKTLGIEVDSQEDVHGFFAILMSRLEDSMSDKEARLALTKFFSGKFVSQIKGECGHVSTRIDTFSDISITVRNKAGLHESLDEFVQGEPMQGSNRYKCATCDPEDGGRLVDAMKRTCLGEVPEHLTFCLKRFTWDGGFEDKVNDRFEFPQEIDMSVYSQSALEDPTSASPDVFELTGVIVHQGSLSFGHYWSYVRTGSSLEPTASRWTRLEDSCTKPVEGGVREVQEQCFGGQKYANGDERTDNAYVLLYRRKASAEAVRAVVNRPCEQETMLERLLPTVFVPSDFAADVESINRQRFRFAHLFDNDFSDYLGWVVRSLPRFTASIEHEPDAYGPGVLQELIREVSSLASTLLLRIEFNHHARSVHLKSCIAALRSMRDAHRLAILYLLRCLTTNFDAYSNIWTHSNAVARSRMSAFLLDCLSNLKDEDSKAYRECLESVLEAHDHLFSWRLTILPQQWSHYFDFLGTLASWGKEETLFILDTFDLCFLTDLMCAAVCENPRNRSWPGMRKLHRAGDLDLRPIFGFLYRLVEHVDLSISRHRVSPDHGLRRVSTHGVCLREREVDFFANSTPHSREQHCNLVFYAAQCEADLQNWQQHSPGKLIALLVGDKDTSAAYRPAVSAALARIFMESNEGLTNMLCLGLHFCAGRGDGDETTQLVKGIVGMISEWNKGDQDGLQFMVQCWEVAPRAVVDNAMLWVPGFLLSSSESLATGTADFCVERVFSLPESDPTELDPARIACLRKLVPHLRQVLQKESQRRKIPTFEPATRLVEQARAYLRDVKEQFLEWSKEQLKSQAAFTIQMMLQLQLDEAATTRRELDELSQVLGGWTLASSSPGSDDDNHDQKSVDEGSAAEDGGNDDDDELTSDEDQGEADGTP